MTPKISVLVAARKNSKYLAKFLFGYFDNTADTRNSELLVMMNADDTWNNELVHFFMRLNPLLPVKFFTEDLRLGRAGLHEYFNKMVPDASGDWLVYFCEDHFITMKNWDDYVRSEIRNRALNPKEPYCIVPKFDNCGAMNQILSRGYVEAIGGVMGRHGWIDSYINDVNQAAFGDIHRRIVRLDRETFHDFTHDYPSPMSDAHLQGTISKTGRMLPPYDDQAVKELVKIDAHKLIEATKGL